jgi:hypothetical protein
MKQKNLGYGRMSLVFAGTICAIIFGCGPQSQSPSSEDGLQITKETPRRPACRQVSGTPQERIDACLDEMSSPRLTKQAKTLIEGIKTSGKLMLAANVDGLSIETTPVRDESGMLDLLMGTNEETVAKTLTEKGYRGFVVSRDIIFALDRDKVVLSRLAHHDFIEWFQLRYVTPDLLVYTVRKSPVFVPDNTGTDLVRGLRARLMGQKATKQGWRPDAVRLLGSLRLQGNQWVLRHAVGSNIEVVLDELADKMRRSWERDVYPEGHGSFASRLDELRIEVHVVMERAPVEPRGQQALFELMELGIDGIMFRHRPGVTDEKFTYMPGSELVTHSMKNIDQFMRYAVKEGGWHDLRPWEDASTRLDMIRTQHFMEKTPASKDVVRLFRGFPVVEMDDLNDTAIRKMLIDGGEWWLKNERDDGSFEYKYWPTQNRRSTEYNEVRHILATRDLADVWRYQHDNRYLTGAENAMDWLMQYAIHDHDTPDVNLPHPPEDSFLFRYPAIGERSIKAPNQKLGTVAVALLGWVGWAKATGSNDRDEEIRRMAVFVLSRLEETGKFDPYFVHTKHSYYGSKNDIVPGEAALALGLVAEYFDEPEWLEFFPKFMDFYEPWFRGRAIQTDPYGRWPHNTYANQVRLDLVQFGPWAVMACKQYYVMTKDERAAKFGLEIADWMIDYYQWSEERSPWPDYVGGYYKMPSELPAMQSFCYGEGTAAAYHIAAAYSPEAKDKYDISTRETIRFLDLMQFDEVSSYFVADQEKVHGGIRYAMNENKIRIDYEGHGLSTLSQYLDAREFDPAVTVEIPAP